MKPLRLQSAIILFVLLLGICGCSQRKPPILIAPQQVPTTVPPEPTPTPEQTGTAADQQPAQSAQQPGAATDQTPSGAEKAKPKSTRRATKKPAGTEKSGEVAKSTPTKIIVPADKSTPPQTSGGQISPGPTPTDNNSQASTEQLLQSAENNLNSIKRQLSKDEEVMQAQIREFIKQSHTAITENDLARAHILAVKARLLSDELVKHQ